MMKVKVLPSAIAGSIHGPASKSCTQRALAAALIKTGKSIIKGAGRSNDELAAREIIQSLGAVIEEDENQLTVFVPKDIFERTNGTETKVVHCGESGLSMRMFAPIAALFHHSITLQGEGSILTRPMDFLDQHLPGLGVTVTSNDGKIPVTVKGPLKAADIEVDGSLSSQFLTGMLYAFSRSADEAVTISVEDLTSRPYIDLTLDVLDRFGFTIVSYSHEVFQIPAYENSPANEVLYTVERDWSNAAFLLVAAAISGEITLSGMDRDSSQADSFV